MPEVFKARLDWALNNVVISGCPRPWQDAWNEMIFKISSNPNHSVILWNLSTRVDSSPKKPCADRNFPAHELLMLRWGSQQTSTMLLQHTNRPQCWAAEGSLSRASEARQKQLGKKSGTQAHSRNEVVASYCKRRKCCRNDGWTPFCTHQKNTLEW